MDYQIANQNHETGIISCALNYMNTLNINQTPLSQHTATGPILAGSNDRLRLTSEDGNKLAYCEKGTLELRNDVLEYIVDAYSPIQEALSQGKYFLIILF